MTVPPQRDPWLPFWAGRELPGTRAGIPGSPFDKAMSSGDYHQADRNREHSPLAAARSGPLRGQSQ
jgi:hypothetical protein